MAEVVQFLPRLASSRLAAFRAEAEAQSLRSDRAYAAHNHAADRAFWKGQDTACSETNPDPDNAA